MEMAVVVLAIFGWFLFMLEKYVVQLNNVLWLSNCIEGKNIECIVVSMLFDAI